jgi:hypothetical protein
MRNLFASLCAATLLVLSVPGCEEEVNLDAVPEAKNNCEPPTAELLNAEAPMLPGRHCMGCHSAGGQAGDRVWTAAGTVYASPTSPCNTGGLPDVRVDIADPADNKRILITLYTNRTGNFFTSETRKFQGIIARVTDTKTGKFKEMSTVAPNADCGSCHYPGGPAGGRIYLN